ncbi:MAG TPA: CBS domain-containing protein, partial [Mizugakiibacter sp.]|nr:CBS domain-containing protein [Mizugakiibacter sp.]
MRQVKHLLASKGSNVYSIDPNQPVLEALQRMAEYRIGALLVMRNKKLLGIISERDYARKVILLGQHSN